jgi:hypothetical protein
LVTSRGLRATFEAAVTIAPEEPLALVIGSALAAQTYDALGQFESLAATVSAGPGRLDSGVRTQPDARAHAGQLAGGGDG